MSNIWVDIVSNGIMLAVAVYAISDTRKQARKMILLERNQVYAKIRNDMAWFYIDPTEHAQSPELAKELKEFCNMAMEAEPGKWTFEDLKTVIDNQSLHFADTLVKSGYATWKTGMDVDLANQKLRHWENDKNRVRIENLLEKKGLV